MVVSDPGGNRVVADAHTWRLADPQGGRGHAELPAYLRDPGVKR